ncbi:MAG: T9SS type A sorting domain-containing protein [Flavobacterium sp.]|nr:MAG: T9SS type A sorting domain-containing protein [Flavobacterium sp.]
MKKITLLLVIVFLNLKAWSQNPNYRYHELQDLGTTIEWAISIECTHHFQPLRVLDVNLKQNFKLEVGKIYKVDLGLTYGNFGTRYYKVTYAEDAGTDKGDEIDTPPDFGAPIPDLCNSLSWKFIRPILLGSSLEEAQSNFCSSLTKNNIDEKVNIKTTTPLIVGNVYFMDFGKGANYYLVSASSTENGDADYEFDPTIDNAVFSSISFNCQKPDLIPVSISKYWYDSNYYYRGSSSAMAEYYIRNVGTNIQNTNTEFTLYLSSRRNFADSNDIKLLTKFVSREDVNGYFGSGLVFNIPQNVPLGEYYLTLKISNREDFNTYNNIVSSASKVVIKNGPPPTTTPPPTPPPTTTKPDLTIDSNNTIINSDCECSSILADLKDKRHRLSNQAGSIRIPFITVKNIGKTISSPTNVVFYLSLDTTLDTADLKSNGSAIKINAIKPGESYVVAGGTIFSTDFGNGGTIFNNNWNILMSVDDSKTNTESNENNNVTAIPITFYNPNAITTQTKPEVNEFSEPYSIEVYNFEGQKVLTKEVKSKDDENKSIELLKRGLYIIKSKNETRKVLKK